MLYFSGNTSLSPLYLRLQTASDEYGNSRAGTLKYIIACDYSSAHIRFPTEENEIPAERAERMSYGSR